MQVSTKSWLRLSPETIRAAARRLRGVVHHTPLMYSHTLSEMYGCKVWMKREDLQVVRSYKIRGAYNKIYQLNDREKSAGVVCASAGNHAQGVAMACSLLEIEGTIFMPHTTPHQKVEKVKKFGKSWIEVVLNGDTFDDAFTAANEYCLAQNQVFIHPFDDVEVISGQGTVGLEILEDGPANIDYLFVPVGGGGLASGVGCYFRTHSPETRIIGVEPEGAPAMKRSLEAGQRLTLDSIDKFVDGAAVKQVGRFTLDICQEVLHEVSLVPEGRICTSLLQLYHDDAIVVEPAGALSVAALGNYKKEIRGKNIVVVLSGSNNDITRTEEIRERSLLFEGLKHFFIIRFPQRAGALREFVVEVLGPEDDITHFEYTKKNNREKGPALVGVELKEAGHLDPLLARMEANGIAFRHVNQDKDLFHLLR